MRSTVLAICALLSAAPAMAETLAHCVGIDAADARLACYDAAAGRPAQPAATARMREAAPAAAAATVAPPTGAARNDDPANFGLTPAQRKTEPVGPSVIQAHIAGLSTDRIGNAIVTLDNGQTWILGDNDSRLEVGQTVTIKRAALGSFLMTTPDRHSYRVRRSR